MKSYGWIAKIIRQKTYESCGCATYAQIVWDYIEQSGAIHNSISFEDIAAVALKEGYQVYRAIYGEFMRIPDYLILSPSTPITWYKEHIMVGKRSESRYRVLHWVKDLDELYKPD